MTLRRRAWALPGIFLVAAVTLLASVGGLSTTDAALQRIGATGTIRIGYAVEAPYAVVRAGRVTGESPELARLIVERMGIEEIEWIQSRLSALGSELRGGRFDVVAAGLFVTPERAEVLAFSATTLQVRPGLLVPAGNPKGIRSFDGLLADATLRLAAIGGSMEEAWSRQRGLADERLLTVPDAVAGRAAVLRGAADALLLSEPTVRGMAASLPDALEVVEMGPEAMAQGPPLGEVAFAFAPHERGLLEAWNRAQAEVVGGTEHLRILEAFGMGISELPGAARSREGREGNGKEQGTPQRD